MIRDNRDIKFDREVKALIDGYSESPPAECWSGISLSLSKRKALRRRKQFYLSISSVAAVMLILFGLFYNSGSDLSINTRESISIVSPPIELKEDFLYSKNRPVSIKSREVIKVLDNDISYISEITNINESVEDIIDSKIITESVVENEVIESETLKKEESFVSQEKMSVDNFLFKESIDTRKANKRWPYLAFSTNLSPSSSRNTVSLIAVNQTPGEYTMSNLVSAEHKSTVIHEVVSNTKFLMPLSFGAQIQYPISNKISIGSGVFYTMLFSHYDVISRNETRETQQTLHYIGIPLNIFYNIYYGNGFRLYLSAGGAFEKGISSNFRVLENGVRHSYSKSIDGVQWSIMGGVGAEFDVSQSVGLYFDPSIAYYFEDNQPISIRTSQPLQYRFELGFRFRL